ncbi:hypothetical protein GCM10010365_08340 [Streptomyces poonensis]|uniref:Uncharacterized protein n=1 Tax=Streptomyces poonensis TaxID=68255 RepID=A0A918UDG7_9ACTN|nr:hypothetical protein GCM10010365_08340 [Streptomyces poonensis]GLJ87728.1 hypothetical protein GCM10017589_03280 [Streptomyces poonensis]
MAGPHSFRRRNGTRGTFRAATPPKGAAAGRRTGLTAVPSTVLNQAVYLLNAIFGPRDSVGSAGSAAGSGGGGPVVRPTPYASQLPLPARLPEGSRPWCARVARRGRPAGRHRPDADPAATPQYAHANVTCRWELPWARRPGGRRGRPGSDWGATGRGDYARFDASSTTVMSDGAPTRTGGPQAPAPRETYSWVSP